MCLICSSSDDKSEEIAFVAFDILSIDDQDYDLKTGKKKHEACALFPEDGPVH